MKTSLPLIPLLYALFATLFTTLAALELPPFQGPDEGAHFVRADEISHGELIARRLSANNAGGTIDLGVINAIGRFYPIAINASARATRDLYTLVEWRKTGAWGFPVTAQYPPALYAPAAITIALCRAASVSLLHTLTAARLANAAASIALGTIAIALAGQGQLFLVAILLLPSSVNVMAGVTQDGPMLGAAALAASLFWRLSRPDCPNWRTKLVVLYLALALIATARPPYLVIALALPLITTTPPRQYRTVSAVALFIVTISWWLICKQNTLVNFSPNLQANSAAQLHFLFTNIGKIPALISNTLTIMVPQQIAGYFITPFAEWSTYNTACAAMLAAAALLTFPARHVSARTLIILGAIFVTSAGLFAAQYLTWTAVGAPIVDGVWGRYFLPLAVMLTAFVNTQRTTNIWIQAPVLAFPVVSIVVTMHQIIRRFYI